MATVTAKDIAAQLERAQREAGELGTELARLVGETEQAVEAKDYGRAAELKRQADELRPRAMLAQGQVEALRQTVNALEEHRRQENAAEIERERQERYQAAVAEYAAVERDSIAEAGRLFDEAQARISEARETLQAALAAEARAGQARREAHQSAVEAGVEQPRMYGPAAPNYVRARIDADQVLTEVLRRTN